MTFTRYAFVPLLLTIGCATLPSADVGLEVAIEHLSAPSVQLIESRAVAKIRIDNETAEPVKLLGGVHRLHINGKRIGKVMDGDAVTIAPYSSVVRDVPLMLANLAVIRSINQTIDSKEADYQLESRLTIATETGRRTVTLRRNGEVSLEELVPARREHSPLTTPSRPVLMTPGIAPTP